MEILYLIIGCIGGAVITSKWEEVKSQLKKIARAFRRLAEITWTASKTLLRNVAQGTAEIACILFYCDEKGCINQRTTVIKDIPESELPDWARAELRAKQHGAAVDITNRRELLELTL